VEVEERQAKEVREEEQKEEPGMDMARRTGCFLQACMEVQAAVLDVQLEPADAMVLGLQLMTV
jgi:hypothetical protein